MHLADELATRDFGARMAKYCLPPLIIYLNGELGSGKTTFARGFIHSLGYTGVVKSPTFSLIETYSLDTVRLYHLDLYRLQDARELEYLGIRDLADEKDSICLIEWPQRGDGHLPQADVIFSFAHLGDSRTVEYWVKSSRGQSIIDQL